MTPDSIANVVRGKNEARAVVAFFLRPGSLISDLNAFIWLRCYIGKRGWAAGVRHAGMITRKSIDLQKEACFTLSLWEGNDILDSLRTNKRARKSARLRSEGPPFSSHGRETVAVRNIKSRAPKVRH